MPRSADARSTWVSADSSLVHHPLIARDDHGRAPRRSEASSDHPRFGIGGDSLWSEGHGGGGAMTVTALGLAAPGTALCESGAYYAAGQEGS